VRKGLIAVGVLVVLVVASDLVLRAVVEGRLAATAETRLGLEERPHVDLKGFPFFLHALSRRFPAASFEANDVRIRGLAIDRFLLELDDVSFGSAATVVGGDGPIAAREARGTLEITEESLGAYLERRDVPLQVALLDSGQARVAGTASVEGMDVELSARGRLVVAGGGLEFQPDRIESGGGVEVPASALTFRVALPEVIPDVVYEGLTVSEGRISLSFRIRGPNILWLF
jgi:hypothetical protein